MRSRARGPKGSASPFCTLRPPAAYSWSSPNTNDERSRTVPSLRVGLRATDVSHGRDLGILHVPALRRALHRIEARYAGDRPFRDLDPKDATTALSRGLVDDAKLVVVEAAGHDD